MLWLILTITRKSLVLHIWKNGSLYLLNFNALPKFFCCKQLNGKMLKYVNSMCLRNIFIDEAELFDQYQNLFEFVQKEHQTNAIYSNMSVSKL